MFHALSRRYLDGFTCYDIMPVSVKMVVLDIQLHVRSATVCACLRECACVFECVFEEDSVFEYVWLEGAYEGEDTDTDTQTQAHTHTHARARAVPLSLCVSVCVCAGEEGLFCAGAEPDPLRPAVGLAQAAVCRHADGDRLYQHPAQILRQPAQQDGGA